jgi:hypothetical protein
VEDRHPNGLLRALVAVGTLMLGGCAADTRIPDPPSGTIEVTDGGARGYQHGADRSKFAVGVGAHRVNEHGYLKLTGADGTIARDQLNGSVFSVPKARAPGQRLTPYGDSPAAHNRFVLDYFRANGLPADQIGRVQGRMLLEATGRSDEQERAVPHVTGYYSVVERVIEGIPVEDSFAWARVNSAGVVVEEGVYWPGLPRTTVEKARQLRDAWKDQKRRSELLDRVHGEDPRTEIAIRHSSAGSHDPFEAFACIDVHVDSTPPATNRALRDSTNGGLSQTSYVRHFDLSGNEIRLPQERFQLTRDAPTSRRSSTQAPAGPPAQQPPRN